MNVYWHRTFHPFGFYDGAQHIAVVPHSAPSPAIIVDHETTHINLTNDTTVGLLQQLCCAAISLAPNQSTAPAIAQSLVKRTEKTHEAIAWFGSEVLTKLTGHETESPPEYATLCHQLRASIERSKGQPYTNWKGAFSSVMAIAEAAGNCALSPEELSWFINSNQALDEKAVEKLLARPENNPQFRLENLCEIIRDSEFPALQNWARSIWNDDGSLRSDEIPALRKPLLKALSRDMVDENARIRRLSELVGRPTSSMDWKLFSAFNCFTPSIDRYAQTCLVEKPIRAKTLELPEGSAAEALAQAPYVVVSVGEAQAFERIFPFPGQEVSIAFGPRITLGELAKTTKKSFWSRLWPKAAADDDQGFVIPRWRTSPEMAESFLRQFAAAGGGIVVGGALYDYGRGDLLERNVVQDLPHAVLYITDMKSLWVKLAILNDRGLASGKTILFKYFPSSQAGNEFGYLVFRPEIGSIPMVVVPCLAKFVDRAVSVFEALPSQFGISAMPCDWPIDVFALGCERALSAAFASFEPNFDW
jgi:hypothetical protein